MHTQYSAHEGGFLGEHAVLWRNEVRLKAGYGACRYVDNENRNRGNYFTKQFHSFPLNIMYVRFKDKR